MLQRHRGTSLCLCFVSVISVPFSIITWQLIPPGAGFWLFNLSLWIRYWLSGPPRGPAEHLNQSIPPHLTWPGPTQSSFGWLLPSLPIFIFTPRVPSRPRLEVRRRQTEAESGWEIEPSCYPLLHKASVLPLTVDGLLCRSLQPMASATILHLLPPFFLPFPPSSSSGYGWGEGGAGVERRTGRVGVEVHRGKRGGWRFDTVRQD